MLDDGSQKVIPLYAEKITIIKSRRNNNK